MAESLRPTKKQRELLTFIEDFINQHGYSPSFREIMTGLQYTSVATVALHVNSLIKRGHLRKRDGKARSLEVVQRTRSADSAETTGNEQWLLGRIEQLFAQVEQTGQVIQDHVDQLFVLVSALRVLGLETAAQAFMPRLSELRVRADQEQSADQTKQ